MKQCVTDEGFTLFIDYIKGVWWSSGLCVGPDPEVIKTFFMLNSAEHEIPTAHKC